MLARVYGVRSHLFEYTTVEKCRKDPKECFPRRRPFKAAGVCALCASSRGTNTLGRSWLGPPRRQASVSSRGWCRCVVGHPEMHKPHPPPPTPPPSFYRFSGVAIHQSGRRGRGVGNIPVPGWVQRKAALLERREHWSERVEGFSLVYLANV